MLNVAILVLVVVGQVCVEVRRRKRHAIDYLTVFNLVFFVYYTLPCLLLALYPDADPLSAREMSLFRAHGFVTVACIAIGYAAIVCGYRLADVSGGRRRWEIAPRSGPCGPVCYSLVLVAISAISIIIYVAQYGGIVPALTKSALIRSGWVEGGPVVFFKRFVLVASPAFLVMYASLMKDRADPKARLSVAAIALLLALLSFVLLSGRGYVLILIGCGLWITSRLSTGRIWPAVLISAVVGALVVAVGDSVFSSLIRIERDAGEVVGAAGRKLGLLGSVDVVEGMLREFRHYSLSLSAAVEAVHDPDIGLRWFVDIVYGLLSYVPERLLGVEMPHSVAYLNTYMLQGVHESRVPPGLLAFGMYSCGLPGVVIIGLLAGFVGGSLERFLDRGAESDPLLMALMVTWGLAWAYSGMQGEPRVFFQSNTDLILATLVAFLLRYRLRYLFPAGECAEDAGRIQH